MIKTIIIFFIIILSVLLLIKYETFQCPAKQIKRPKCRPPLLGRIYLHMMTNFTPIINDKKLVSYVRANDIVESILKPINLYFERYKLTFEILKLYVEDADDNLAYYYPNHVDRDLEFKSISNTLQNIKPNDEDNIKLRNIFINLIKPYNIEKKGYHIFIVPYLDGNIGKIIHGEEFPLIFISEYSKIDSKIIRNFDTIPRYTENIKMKKMIYKFLAYSFGLKHSNIKNNLMSNDLGMEITEDQIDLLRKGINTGRSIIHLDYNNEKHIDIVGTKKISTSNVKKPECRLLVDPHDYHDYKCLLSQNELNNFYYRADPDSIPNENSKKIMDLYKRDLNQKSCESQSTYMEQLKRSFMSDNKKFIPTLEDEDNHPNNHI